MRTLALCVRLCLPGWAEAAYRLPDITHLLDMKRFKLTLTLIRHKTMRTRRAQCNFETLFEKPPLVVFHLLVVTALLEPAAFNSLAYSTAAGSHLQSHL